MQRRDFLKNTVVVAVAAEIFGARFRIFQGHAMEAGATGPRDHEEGQGLRGLEKTSAGASSRRDRARDRSRDRHFALLGWPLAPFLAGRGALNAQCRGAGGKRT